MQLKKSVALLLRYLLSYAEQMNESWKLARFKLTAHAPWVERNINLSNLSNCRQTFKHAEEFINTIQSGDPCRQDFDCVCSLPIANDARSQPLAFSFCTGFHSVNFKIRKTNHLSTPPLCVPSHRAVCLWLQEVAEERKISTHNYTGEKNNQCVEYELI